jgi:hypothetical protein
LRVRRSKGAARTDIDRFIEYQRLPPDVRRKGPRVWTDEWCRWIDGVNFIDSLPAKYGMTGWSLFVELTVDQRRAAERGLGRAPLGPKTIQAWSDRVARMVGQHPLVLFAHERTREGEREVPALVALPPGVRTPTMKQVKDAWSCGHAVVRKFRPAVGGAAYVTKRGDWGQTFGCPRLNACRRRTGCRWMEG